jgi:hypothetical protein
LQRAPRVLAWIATQLTGMKLSAAREVTLARIMNLTWPTNNPIPRTATLDEFLDYVAEANTT